MTASRALAAGGLALLVSCLALSGCKSDRDRPFVDPADEPPIFRGVSSASTAGGAFVRLDWRPAVDDRTPSAQIAYVVFAAPTAGGQDFSAPVLATAPGATTALVSAAHTPLVAAGQRVFFVVRASDGAGLRDDNQVELSAIPVDDARVALVDDGAAGTGTLGSRTDPFPRIQDAVDDVQAAGGGVVLVSAGAGGTSYSELVTTGSSAVSSVAIYGGFPRFGTLPATATGGDILASRNVATNETRLDATSLAAADGDVLRIANGFRPTFVDGFAFIGTSNTFVQGFDVDLELSACSFEDGGQLVLVTLAASGSSRARVVGNAFTGASVLGIQAGGGFGVLRVDGNDTSGRAPSFRALGPTGALNVPASGSSIAFTHNVFLDSSTAIDLRLAPVDPAAGGALSLLIDRNEVRDASATGIRVADFAHVGANGIASVAVRRNLVVGTAGNGVQLDVLGPTTFAGVDAAILVEENRVLGSDGAAVDVVLGVSAGRTTSFTCRDNVLAASELQVLRVSDQDPSGIGLSDEGRLVCRVQGNVHPGGGEAIEVELGVAHGGRTDVEVVENSIVASAAEGVHVELEPYVGTTAVARAFPDGALFATIFNNDVRGGDGAPLALLDTRLGDASAAFAFAGRNVLAFAGDPGPGSASGMKLDARGRELRALVWRSFLGASGQDVDENALDLEGSGDAIPGIVRVLNCTMTGASGGGLEVGSLGGRPQIVNDTVAFNGQAGQFGIEADIGDPQAFIHNCIVSHNARGDVDAAQGVRTTFSLVRDQRTPIGFGDASGEPLFAVEPDALLAFPLALSTAVRDMFTLAPASPARDAGDPDAAFADPDGTRCDMGAFGGSGAGTIGLADPDTAIPLVFLGTLPAVDLSSGAELVAISSAVSFAFTRPVALSSASGGVSIASGGGAVPGAFSTALDGHLLTFTPATALSQGGDPFVSVRLASGLRDTSGAALAFPATFRFAVKPLAATPETEPNDVDDGVVNAADMTAAQVLPAGPAPSVLRVAGSLGGAGNIDVYRVRANAGDRIMVTAVRVRAGATGGVALEVRDASGALLAAGQPIAFRGDPYLDFTPRAGADVFIVVRDNGAVASPPATYELQGVLD